MPSVRAHFEDRAARLSERASIETLEKAGALTIRLCPRSATAVGVVLYLSEGEHGTVALDDHACAPAELGQDPVADAKAVDYFMSVAVEGRATAFHVGRGGCIEIRQGETTSRTWKNAWPWPGWRGRAARVDYEPYA
jgi:hypothetical protein